MTTALRALAYLALATGVALIAAAIAVERLHVNLGLTAGGFTFAAIVALGLWWAAELGRFLAARAQRAAQVRETSTLLAHLNSTTYSGSRH